MKKLIFIALFILPHLYSFAQDEAGVNVYGRLVDSSDGSVLVGATVQLYNLKDSSQSKYVIADVDGIFLFQKVNRAFYKLIVRSMGYKPYSRVIRVMETEMNLGNVLIDPDSKMLDEIKVEAAVVAMEQKGDTTQYNAEAYKVNPDASTLDLVSKMPGIVIENGGVTANGETVGQVLLDGKRFFGQDPLLSLNTLPADVVKRVEVFDQKSERSQFTGVDDGNTTKTLNVVTKEDRRNGQFGKVYAGYGTDERYKAGANLNTFNGDRRVTVIGMTNNINQQNFSDEDLAEVSGGRGGFRRGGGNLLVGAQSGITQTNAIGVNFTDNLGDKVDLEGSYFFNQSNNSRDQTTNREIFRGDSLQFYNEQQNQDTENLNHRLNARLTYNINDNNQIRFRPSISYQDNQSLNYTVGLTQDEAGNRVNQTENNFKSSNQSYNVDNYLSYMHKFKKIGRSASVELRTNYRNTDRENYYEDVALDSITQYLTDESDYTLSAELSYAEPVGNTSQLGVSYEISYRNRASDKNSYIVDPESGNKTYSTLLSNEFTSGYTVHKPEINFSNSSFGKFYRFGLAYQYAELNNQQYQPETGQYHNGFSALLPFAMGRVELGDKADMFMMYRSSTSAPSINQLQNVIDNSNPLFISMGNPELDQSYSHMAMVRFNRPNPDNNTSISNFTRVQMTHNFITNSTRYAEKDSVYTSGVVVQKGAQISQPINLDGFWTVNNNTTHSIMIEKLKSNLNTSIGFNYTRLPGQIEGKSNIAHQYNGNFKLGVTSNISENFDFNIYYQVDANRVYNTSNEDANTSYMTQTTGGKLNLIFAGGFVFRNDIYYQKYNGLSEASDSEYVLWNMSVARKFLKNDAMEIELSVFDLLGQNQSFSQNVTSAYVQETRTEVLQQYFMLTASYQLRRFKTDKN
ncbi:TonB-dependent receptor family protein [Reichenbachiella ulvae]|uniref:TonB-dependent receptor family protein n=1 Tax=Reichenbachiella ulvae TaxID=2980104 RepID=A0ABT3CYN7_9BACT|nr:TonB-dependent receptor family protein [Reichenbachiella ulvae]MCV9388639.1 TonB-dependent receptor family protein [Reichenbachiella ulvae]